MPEATFSVLPMPPSATRRASKLQFWAAAGEVHSPAIRHNTNARKQLLGPHSTVIRLLVRAVLSTASTYETSACDKPNSWRIDIISTHGDDSSECARRPEGRHRIFRRPRYERGPSLDARQGRDSLRIHRQPRT